MSTYKVKWIEIPPPAALTPEYLIEFGEDTYTLFRHNENELCMGTLEECIDELVKVTGSMTFRYFLGWEVFSIWVEKKNPVHKDTVLASGDPADEFLY